MPSVKDLLDNNKAWSDKCRENDADFFQKSAMQQSPEYLWIGCADSRVPANDVIGAMPGELFVHRNIANMVVHSDLNLLSVVQYAVDVLKVKNIIVCGHYGCGGVRASLHNDKNGIIDNWLLELKDLAYQNGEELSAIENVDERVDRLCELNVMRQVRNLAHTTIVQESWTRGQPLAIHGWIYGLKDGLITDLDVSVTGPDDIEGIYKYDL